MKYYDNKDCSVSLLCQLSGSVFPQALMVALPNVLITIGVALLLDAYFDGKPRTELGGGQLWSSYNMAIGLLLVFRTQQAYSRWWEGGTLLQQVRGEWYNAASSLVAFTSTSADKIQEVQNFQHLLVRLMSMLYCSALQQIAMMDDECFEIIDNDGIDQAKLDYLSSCHDRCEVLLQWIQRLIVENMGKQVLPIPPPVISRVFQELSRGIVNLNNASKIKSFPFPFPYAQMVQFMLSIHWMLTPLVNCLLVSHVEYAAVLSFVSIFAFWSINYIAVEIEMPFGNDANDLPIAKMQRDMNRSLLILLDKRVQEPPVFDYRKSFHQRASFKHAQKLVQMQYSRNLSESWPCFKRGTAANKSTRSTFSIQSLRGTFWKGGRHSMQSPVNQTVDWQTSDAVPTVYGSRGSGSDAPRRSAQSGAAEAPEDSEDSAASGDYMEFSSQEGWGEVPPPAANYMPPTRYNQSVNYNARAAPGPMYDPSNQTWVPRTLTPPASPRRDEPVAVRVPVLELPPGAGAAQVAPRKSALRTDSSRERVHRSVSYGPELQI